MAGLITPQNISDLVLGERQRNADFERLQAEFARDIQQLTYEHSHRIQNILGAKRGPSYARKLFIAAGRGHWFTGGAKDFSGIYVWYHQQQPFYVGISRGVLVRLKQHVNGKNHFSASMAYKIARTLHRDYDGGRGGFDPDHVMMGLVQNWLLDQYVAMLPVADPDQLALFEIYCSMTLQTKLNTFETH